jgi:hypothetical protein
MRGSLVKIAPAWWRTPAVVLMLALAGASPAAARTSRQRTVTMTGSLTIAWHGDLTRGCAAVGQCGVSGMLQILPSGAESSSGGIQLDVSDSSSAVRVTQTGAGGTVQSTCTDLVPVYINYLLRRVGGRPEAVSQPFQPPSSGRCAGPTSADLAHVSLPVRMPSPDRYDLAGRTTFGAGPFSVTVISSLAALITSGTPSAGGPFTIISSGSVSGVVSGPGSPPRTHQALEEHAAVTYRITSIAGALSTGFSGLASPSCRALGACGVTGEEAESFAAHATIEFLGSRTVKRRVGSATALTDLRAGRLRLNDTFSSVPFDETVTETASGGGSSCSSQVHNRQLRGGSRMIGDDDELRLAPEAGGFGGGFPSPDPFRTRCPGPSVQDVFGSDVGSLAHGTIATGRLGGRRLIIVLRGDGRFAGDGYAGQRQGAIVLTLTLTRANAGTRRVELIGRPPPPVMTS